MGVWTARARPDPGSVNGDRALAERVEQVALARPRLLHSAGDAAGPARGRHGHARRPRARARCGRQRQVFSSLARRRTAGLPPRLLRPRCARRATRVRAGRPPGVGAGLRPLHGRHGRRSRRGRRSKPLDARGADVLLAKVPQEMFAWGGTPTALALALGLHAAAALRAPGAPGLPPALGAALLLAGAAAVHPMGALAGALVTVVHARGHRRVGVAWVGLGGLGLVLALLATSGPALSTAEIDWAVRWGQTREALLTTPRGSSPGGYGPPSGTPSGPVWMLAVGGAALVLLGRGQRGVVGRGLALVLTLAALLALLRVIPSAVGVVYPGRLAPVFALAMAPLLGAALAGLPDRLRGVTALLLLAAALPLHLRWYQGGGPMATRAMCGPWAPSGATHGRRRGHRRCLRRRDPVGTRPHGPTGHPAPSSTSASSMRRRRVSRCSGPRIGCAASGPGTRPRSPVPSCRRSPRARPSARRAPRDSGHCRRVGQSSADRVARTARWFRPARRPRRGDELARWGRHPFRGEEHQPGGRLPCAAGRSVAGRDQGRDRRERDDVARACQRRTPSASTILTQCECPRAPPRPSQWQRVQPAGCESGSAGSSCTQLMKIW